MGTKPPDSAVDSIWRTRMLRRSEELNLEIDFWSTVQKYLNIMLGKCHLIINNVSYAMCDSCLFCNMIVSIVICNDICDNVFCVCTVLCIKCDIILCTRDDVKWDKEQEEEAIKVVEENAAVKVSADLQGIKSKPFLKFWYIELPDWKLCSAHRRHSLHA